VKYFIALIGVILVALSIANSVDAVQPEAQVEVVSYTVHHGDTLWSIANHYAPEHIKDIREFMWQICQDDRNQNLFKAGRLLQPGDHLLIPLSIKK
jgi:hypothetical protein